MRSRRDDARLDAAICDSMLRWTGAVEPDEPTAYSHAVWMERWRQRMYGEFTPEERGQIRALLGLAVSGRAEPHPGGTNG